MIKKCEMPTHRASTANSGTRMPPFPVGRSLLNLAFALTLTLVLAACGVTQKLDGMYDSTKHLSTATDDLSNKEGELYDALRQGNALQTRRDSLTQMIQANDAGRKISEAGKYFMAFEFQIWSAMGEDTPSRREELETLAAREFMRDVQEFIKPGQTDPQPLAQGDPADASHAEANREACLNSLSVAMHITNPKQDELEAKDPSVKQVTMYMMIQNSLRAKPLIDAGTKKMEDFPAYVKEVLVFEDVARLLVQTRFNFFGAMLLASTSNVRDGTVAAGRLRFFDWNLNIDNEGVVAIGEDTLFMTGALKVAAFMAQINMAPKLDSTLSAMLRHAQYPASVQANIDTAKSLNLKGSTSQVSALAKAQFDFANAFEAYRKN